MKLLYVGTDEKSRGDGPDYGGQKPWCQCQVYRVPDPYEAVDYLSGLGCYIDRSRFPLPDLLCLSLACHSWDALDLLAWLRVEEQFHGLPVLVLGPATLGTRRCARELAPRAWFSPTADAYELRDLCEKVLGSEALSRARGPQVTGCAWPGGSPPAQPSAFCQTELSFEQRRE